MLSPQQRREYIRQIEKLPQFLEEALKGISEEKLDLPYREGGWTRRQVVHHLADSHLNAFVRMKLILTETHPTLKPYDQEEWAKLPDSTALPIHSSVAIIRGLHERWAALLKSIPDSAWGRTAHHPESGTVSLDQLLEVYARHGEKHLNHIGS